MSLIQLLSRWHTNLPYTDPIKRRLAPVFQVFLVGLIAILLFAVVLSLIITGPSLQALAGLMPAFVFGLALVIGLYTLRRGKFNVAIGIIVVALLLNQERNLLVNGFLQNQQALLTSIWPLMLAGFLLNRRWLILTALVNFLGIAFVAVHEQSLLTPVQLASMTTPIARLTGFALITILTCILLDTLARALRSELAASIQRQHDLEAQIAAREEAEQLLAQQREQYRVTLASIGDAVIATDTAGKVTFLNEIAEDLVGWRREESLGQPLSDVFPIFNEDTLLPVENPLTRVLVEGTVVGLANHTVLIKRDGATKIPIADSGAPIRDSDGNIIGAVLVFRDVTEERKAEIALKASEERFRTMADNAPVLIRISGVDKRYTYFNKQWLDFTGRAVDQELGKGWLDNVHPDDKDRCWETYSGAFDKRESFSMEYRLRRNDGEFRWVIENGDPHHLADGSFIGYIGSCLDITTRKEAEERTQLLQMLTEALSSALTAEEVARVFIEKGFSLLGADRGTVALLRADQSLDIVGQYNMPSALLEMYMNAELDSTPLGRAIRTQSPVWIENFETYQQLFPHLAEQVSSPSQNQAIVCLPMVVHNHTLGGISIRFRYQQQWYVERREFMLSLAGQCAQAMERAQLHHQSQLTAALEERQRLARELHDAVSQTLFSATIIAESLPNTWLRNQTRGAEQLHQLITLNRAAMSEMRTLLLELRPEALLKTRMSTLLQHLVDAAKGRRAIETQLQVEGEDGILPQPVHVALYRIAQESINNVLKHSEATEVSIWLQMEPERAQLRIRDNGKGFALEPVSDGLGLDNIRERASAIQATLDIQSQPNIGTEVSVTWAGEGDSLP